MLGEYDIDPIILSPLFEDCEIENNFLAFADDSQLVLVSESLLLCQLGGITYYRKCSRKQKSRKRRTVLVKVKPLFLSSEISLLKWK